MAFVEMFAGFVDLFSVPFGMLPFFGGLLTILAGLYLSFDLTGLTTTAIGHT